MGSKLLKRQNLLTTSRFEVLQDTVEFVTDVSRVYELVYVNKPNAVLIIPEFKGKIGLILVDRYLVQDESYELIGGRMEPEDTSELDAAKRELREETNLNGTNWTWITETYPLPSVTSEKTFIFHCDIEDISECRMSKYENIKEINFFARNEIIELIKNNKLKSSIDAFALLFYYLKT